MKLIRIYLILTFLMLQIATSAVVSAQSEPDQVAGADSADALDTASENSTAAHTLLKAENANAQDTNIDLSEDDWISFSSSYSIFDGELLSRGAKVTAHDPTGRVCGEFTVRIAGYFGPLRCYFDDPDTVTDEGIDPGDIVTFRVNNAEIGSFLVIDPAQNTQPTGPPVNVPEPITIILFGGGVLGVSAKVWRQKRRDGK